MAKCRRVVLLPGPRHGAHVSRQTIAMTDDLHDYMLEVSLREPDIMRRLRDETASLESARMQISPEQGQFMSLLVELLGIRNAIEVGTFTGYSSLAVALAMPPTGRVVALDISEGWTAIARRYWQEAGVADRIELRLGAAEESLDELLAEGRRGGFDFAFIDADKRGLAAYYERCLELVRSGGLIAIDNTLWSGRVADSTVTDEDTEAIRSFNSMAARDERVSLSLVPIGDGLTLARKR